MKLFYFLVVAGLAGTVVAAYLLLSPPYEVPEGSDVFEVVEGRWAWSNEPDGCSEAPQAIRFSRDRTLMLITREIAESDSIAAGESVTTYDVVDHSRSSIRGAIRGETRLTDDGEPAQWDLVLRSPDAFVWHRVDWADYSFTAALIRCPDDVP